MQVTLCFCGCWNSLCQAWWWQPGLGVHQGPEGTLWEQWKRGQSRPSAASYSTCSSSPGPASPYAAGPDELLVAYLLIIWSFISSHFGQVISHPGVKLKYVGEEGFLVVLEIIWVQLLKLIWKLHCFASFSHLIPRDWDDLPLQWRETWQD